MAGPPLTQSVKGPLSAALQSRSLARSHWHWCTGWSNRRRRAPKNQYPLPPANALDRSPKRGKLGVLIKIFAIWRRVQLYLLAGHFAEGEIARPRICELLFESVIGGWRRQGGKEAETCLPSRQSLDLLLLCSR